MSALLKNIFYSFPVQLFILHFRKYQVLLLFWYLPGSAINSGFMKSFGADALFFLPEYSGKVNITGAIIVGIALGVFFMSWNITTFILHSKRCKFLATTTRPFLKYCVNNSVLPFLFLLFYFIKLYRFDEYRELMGFWEIITIMLGILLGVILLLVVSFAYFFSAETRIVRSIAPIISNVKEISEKDIADTKMPEDKFGMKVSYYIGTRFKMQKTRSVAHYNQDYLDIIFKRHHFSAIISILLAFVFLVAVGFFMDNKFFQVPAAASIFIFFAIMTAFIGAITYFMQSWSLLFVVLLIAGLDILYQAEIIDPRNKAYGLNYTDKNIRPDYNKQSLQSLCTPEKITADKKNMLAILEKWKAKQQQEKPVMIFINVSGGGLRSATFTMNTLQQLDKITNGKLMQHTMLISGASGGMLAATYYRELYRNNLEVNPATALHIPQFTNNIAGDLLNPVFSSMIARDIFSPAQKFTVNGNQYVKDRGYAFEEQLNENSKGLLNKQIKDFTVDEATAKVPLLIFNSVVTRDGRKMMVGSQPLSFMMKPAALINDTTASPDAVDFAALFAKQQPMNLRLLTALRMNATFPYVLPNVWLPSKPVIDVMDAGLRDNFGLETTLRFIENFKDWIQQNTGGVIIIQLRDRKNDNWQQPFETGSITDIVVKPGTMLQHNWYKLQDYSETDAYSYFTHATDSFIHRITFMYVPEKEDKGAALNFHLTAREKRDVIASFNNSYNQAMKEKLLLLLK